MAASTPRVALEAVNLNGAHLLYSRIRQARGLVQALDLALTDRVNHVDRLGLSDPVLQKLAWATNDLLEQAQDAMVSEQPDKL